MFQLKKFTVNDANCAMKVGTDGILLGAWVTIKTEQTNVLDVGTGSGIITLMLAQRFNFIQIDAIEIDTKASEQCLENFINSDWNDRLHIKNTSFQDYVKSEHKSKFDLIISNPPFFETHQQIDEKSRNFARNNQSLPFDVLIKGCKELLKKDGQIALIFPYQNFDLVVNLALQQQLFLQKVCHVKGKPNSNYKRSLVVFGFEKLVVKEEILILKNIDNTLSEIYKNLVKDFYLNL